MSRLLLLYLVLISFLTLLGEDQSILFYWLTWIWYLIAFLLDLQTNSMEVDNTIHILVSQALSILIVLFVSIRLFCCLLFSIRRGGLD